MLRAPDQAALLQAHLMQHDSAPLLAAHAMGVAHAWSLEALTWGDARALVRGDAARTKSPGGRLRLPPPRASCAPRRVARRRPGGAPSVLRHGAARMAPRVGGRPRAATDRRLGLVFALPQSASLFRSGLQVSLPPNGSGLPPMMLPAFPTDRSRLTDEVDFSALPPPLPDMASLVAHHQALAAGGELPRRTTKKGAQKMCQARTRASAAAGAP
jgi:hypothetical protein